MSPKHLKEGEEVGEELGTEEQPNVPEEEDVDSEIKTEEEEDEEKAMDLDELLRRERMREKEEKMEAPGKASVREFVLSCVGCRWYFLSYYFVFGW